MRSWLRLPACSGKGALGSALVGLAALSGSADAQQQVVTDPYGTQYLIDALPPTMQTDITQTQQAVAAGQGGEGPLKVDGAGAVYLAEAPALDGLSPEPLVPALTGIVLVSTPGDVRPEGWPGVTGIWHDFEDFPHEVGASLTSYLGQPVSLLSLDEMLKEAIRAYRTAGRPVVDLSLPEQDITSGVVQVVVVEGRIGRVRIEGVDAETEQYLRTQITVKEGDQIESRQLLRDLNWLNKSPYRKLDLVYVPGAEFGETDVLLRATETDPVFFYLGYEDSGTEGLGRDRILFGANWGNAFGPDQALSYQYTTDIEFDRVQGHSLVYTGPNRWRHYMKALVSFVDVESTDQVQDISIDSGGESFQGSLRYEIPLNWDLESQSHELEFGFDYKNSNNNLLFGGDDVFDVTTEIFQFTFGYNILQRDRWGITQLDLTGVWSPGNWTTDNSDDVFQEARADAKADYVYANARIERQNRLPAGFTLRMRGEGQVSNGNLLASEQLGIGGYDTIRGFEQRLIRGDNGVWGSAEVFTPSTSIGKYLKWKNETDELRGIVFVDAGTVGNVDRVEDEPSSVDIMSVGAGIRWRYSDWFRLRLDYGYPVSASEDGIDDSGRFHIGATANF